MHTARLADRSLAVSFWHRGDGQNSRKHHQVSANRKATTPPKQVPPFHSSSASGTLPFGTDEGDDRHAGLVAIAPAFRLFADLNRGQYFVCSPQPVSPTNGGTTRTEQRLAVSQLYLDRFEYRAAAKSDFEQTWTTALQT